jgi:hypothetical protein
LVDLSGGVTQATRGIPPRPQCHEHEENSGGPCIPCKHRREWDEKHGQAAAADELDRKRTARATALKAQRDCRLCDEEGWLLGDDGTPIEPGVKCVKHHEEAAHA